LPRVMATRFMTDYGLSEYDATQLTQSRAVAAYFEEATKVSGEAKLVSNWIMGEVSRRLKSENLDITQAPVSPTFLATLIQNIVNGNIANNGARQAFDRMWSGYGLEISVPGTGTSTSQGFSIDKLIDELGIRQSNDTGELEAIIATVLTSNAKSVEEYKAGNAKAFNALVGQAMKATKGKGNPAQVNELLKKKLG
jgi:aspartyl-tRNA(Asn)/glutamyl-tRNA(Gln) amidotransferase subunit B